MDELKPCPFCGGKGRLITDTEKSFRLFPIAWVECTECNARAKFAVAFWSDGKHIDNAIEAWNRRTGNTDVISRQDAIDLAVQIIKEWHGLEDDDADAIKYKFMGLLPAQQWISTKERLPTSDNWVIVTILDESGDSRFTYTDTGFHWRDGWWFVDNEVMSEDGSIRVVAWMPLPEPWECGDSDGS